MPDMRSFLKTKVFVAGASLKGLWFVSRIQMLLNIWHRPQTHIVGIQLPISRQVNYFTLRQWATEVVALPMGCPMNGSTYPNALYTKPAPLCKCEVDN